MLRIALIVLLVGCTLPAPGAVTPPSTPPPSPVSQVGPAPGASCNAAGSATVVGTAERGVITPTPDVTFCALTFTRPISSCLVTEHIIRTGAGIGPSHDWSGNVLSVTAAQSWSLTTLDYDCKFEAP